MHTHRFLLKKKKQKKTFAIFGSFYYVSIKTYLVAKLLQMVSRNTKYTNNSILLLVPILCCGNSDVYSFSITLNLMILKEPGLGFAHLGYLFLANASFCVEFQLWLCVTGAQLTSSHSSKASVQLKPFPHYSWDGDQEILFLYILIII